MSRQKSKNELSKHKTQSISNISNYIESLIKSDNPRDNSKADKLCYWLTDWTNFLGYESSFNPGNLRRYKRGEIVKVHLGFNVGSEEGGLHYAVVIEKDNPKTSPVVTVVPLTSVKPHTDLSRLKSGSLFLGNELFTSLSSKISSTEKQLQSEQDTLLEFCKEARKAPVSDEALQIASKKINECAQKLDFIKNMQKEIHKMKIGSIALVNQITTVSKIRIYDPKTDHDILSNIKLSNEKLDLIDSEIIKKYTNSK